MFGKHRKTMSPSAKHVMAMGVKAGNISPPPMKREVVKKVSAVKGGGEKPRNRLGALGEIK